MRVDHYLAPNRRATASPKPENSRETPQRSRKRWLLSLRPKPARAAESNPRAGSRRDRREVVRCIVQSETVAVAEAAVHFNSGDEVFAAETAAHGRGLQGQRTAGADGVAELPGIAAGEVLGGDGVFGDVPAFESFREQQLGFEFVIVFLAGDGVRDGVVGFDVVAFDFFQNFVGAAGLLVLDVEHGIDEVLVLEQAEAILPAEAGEDGAVVEGGLAVEVEFGGPPGGGAVFEFGPEGVEVVAGALRAEGGKVFDFEAAWLFEVVVVGDDVGALLRERGESEEGQCDQQERSAAERVWTAECAEGSQSTQRGENGMVGEQSRHI